MQCFKALLFLSAMFCSKKCMNEASKKFHNIECDFNIGGFGTFYNVAIRASLRAFLVALSIFDGSINELKQFMNSNETAPDVTVFDVDMGDGMFMKQLLLAMNSLCTNAEKRSSVELFRRAIACTILCDFLGKHSQLSVVLSDEDNAIFFMKFISKHSLIAESNYHELYALSPHTSHQVNEQFGVGGFPFSSLLNHSCSPNVLRLTFDGSNYIIVSRKIEKGNQIFDNYG